MLLPKPLEERVHGETGNKTLKVSDHRRTGPAAQRRDRQVCFPVSKDSATAGVTVEEEGRLI